MRTIATLLRRHTLWVGFAAVIVPLILLLILQFQWLSRLEQASVLAHRAALANLLEAVGNEIKYFYRSNAERVLNVPASLFETGNLKKIAAVWEKRPVDGARLFIADFTHEPYGNFFVFDPSRGRLFTPPASEEAMAMIVACTPWQFTTHAEVDQAILRVDERDPDHRIIFNPIVNDTAGIVGIAGMILDEHYLRKEMLPATIKEALPAFFPSDARSEVVVQVRDNRGSIVYATGDGEPKAGTIKRPLPFVFTDWTMEIYNRGSTPEQWARANFAFNVTLSVLLVAALMGGLWLAFRAANRAVRLSEMKSEFVSNVSHELRTPLASIRVFGEFLRLGRAQTPERIKEYGGFIEAESHRLSRLIDNILDFSRIESGRKTYNFLPTDMVDLVSATIESFELRLRESGFTFRRDCREDSLPHPRIDPDAMGQALSNLIDNAVKYSETDKEIQVGLRRTPDGIVVSVRDKGIGIARDEQAKIFDRFHRVSTGLVHDVKGSGLGLSIVHHIVLAHGGRIVVDSEPGRGSTFSIILPAFGDAVFDPAGETESQAALDATR